jgi:hypothetical protein
MRHSQSAAKPNGHQATLLVDKKSKEELQHLGDDLAIVSPLVDGRLRDVAAKSG